MAQNEEYAAVTTQAELGRIFWGYGVVGFIAIAVLVNWALGMTVHKRSVALIGVVFSFFYAIGWVNATWRAANRFQGFSLWRTTAKMVVILVVLYWIAMAVKIASYFF